MRLFAIILALCNAAALPTVAEQYRELGVASFILEENTQRIIDVDQSLKAYRDRAVGRIVDVQFDGTTLSLRGAQYVHPPLSVDEMLVLVGADYISEPAPYADQPFISQLFDIQRLASTPVYFDPNLSDAESLNYVVPYDDYLVLVTYARILQHVYYFHVFQAVGDPIEFPETLSTAATDDAPAEK